MKKIFILTGEPSGDKLASKVISKLQKNNLTLLIIFHNYSNKKNLRITKKCFKEFLKMISIVWKCEH